MKLNALHFNFKNFNFHTNYRFPIWYTVSERVRDKEKWWDQRDLNLCCLVHPLFSSVIPEKVGELFSLTCILVRYTPSVRHTPIEWVFQFRFWLRFWWNSFVFQFREDYNEKLCFICVLIDFRRINLKSLCFFCKNNTVPNLLMTHDEYLFD